MEWNIAPEFCALVILVIIWMYEKKGSNIPNLKNKIFLGCLIITFIGIVSNITSTLMIYHYKEVPIWLTCIVTTIYFIFTPLMGLVYFYYAAATIYSKYYELKKVLIVAAIPMFCFFIVIAGNFYTKSIFYISEDLGYVRGKFIIVTYLIFYLYCFLTFCLVAYKHSKIERKNIGIFLVFPILSVLIIAFQQTHPNLILTGFAASCSLLIVYLYLQNKQIYIDYLTRIPNRWELMNMLDFLLQSGKKTENISLIIISLRDFRMINDRYGQQIGDAFLQKISNFLCGISPRGSVYRFNGDEFAVLLSEEVDMDIESFIAQIRKEMERMWRIEEYSFYLSIAIGVVTGIDKVKTVDSLIHSAEYAVVEAKKDKNNNVCFFDDDMFVKMERKKRIAEILRQKLKEESFEMYYQPIYSTSEKKFLNLESLIRLNDTPIGPIYPSEFIPIAEETGIIIEMTYVIVDKVCKFIKSLMDHNIPIECVHVNFSPLQFSQNNLGQRVLEIIEKNNIPSNTIKIEFTESAIADSTDTVVNFSKEMESHGIKMGLDDFGTGYSNVSTVTNIPFHAVKIDKSLVWMSLNNESGASVVKNIIEAFSSIGMQVVVEGIETKEQIEKFIEYGVDQIQGYYFSKPLPSEEAIQFLKENNSTIEVLH